MLPNGYSRQWFTTFLGRIDPAIVAREVAFLERQLGGAKRMLDLCCGPARHAEPLSRAGRQVIGVDVDAAALHDARKRAPDASFVRGDMRALPLPAGAVDAVICMWQSFGQFDAATNQSVLAEIRRVLLPGGLAILDVYERDFHASRLGERVIERDGVRVQERRMMHGTRLAAHLRYESDGSEDVFEWQLYTASELAQLGASLGFELRLACAEFDEQIPASAEHARMQIVFNRLSEDKSRSLATLG
jgi:SAM-dependent methyltransferase